MQPIVTDVAWSVCVCMCVSAMLDTLASPAKTAELIEVPFGVYIDSGGPNKPCIRWESDLDMGRERAIWGYTQHGDAASRYHTVTTYYTRYEYSWSQAVTYAAKMVIMSRKWCKALLQLYTNLLQTPYLTYLRKCDAQNKRSK